MLDAVLRRKVASVTEFSIFDIYRGAALENGKKSVAFRIVMQDTDRTLTDSEADSKVSEVVKVLSQDFGATLRK
jgi:phenylalanyl-tRNA synthetase beta chain